ncbi:MAG: ribosome-associated translation inhibitor RaiA [bacterium]|nr:ribosome-associated translation inhibitor RaiA [bacterium]
MLKIDAVGRNYHIDDELEEYINQKLGGLDRFLPREHKSGQMRVEIFKDPSGKEDNHYKCKAHLDVPTTNIIAQAATMNPHAAIDIVEEKLKLQIRKYKDKYKPRRAGLKELFDRIRPRRG